MSRKIWFYSASAIRRYDRALTLSELLVAIVILGILATLSVQTLAFLQRRERLNSLALEIAGWIEQVRNQAANEVRESNSQGGCLITFSNQVNGGAGTQLASIDSSQCSGLPYSVLRIPSAQDSVFSIRSNASGSQGVRFTPRGMILESPDLSGEFEYRFILSDGAGPKRCVRISDITGTVDIGYDSGSDLSLPCSRYGVL